MQRKTLRQWAGQAQVVVVARVRTPLQVWSAPDGSDHQEYFSLEVVETLAGDPGARVLDVFAHAEGEPRIRAGDTLVLFLDRTGLSPEFTALAERFPFFTGQGAGQEWRIDPDDPTVPTLVRQWRALQTEPDDRASLRLVIVQLQAGDPRLAADAIVELVRLRGRPDFAADPEDRASLVAMSQSADRPVAQRLALIQILDGVEGFSAVDAIVSLARSRLSPPERVVVARACARVLDPQVTRWLGEMLESSGSATRIAALGSAAGRPELADQIVSLTDDPDPQVARAAVRALGADSSPKATAALERIAAGEGPAAALAAGVLRGRDRPS